MFIIVIHIHTIDAYITCVAQYAHLAPPAYKGVIIIGVVSVVSLYNCVYYCDTLEYA
jgi:hypothetical protein